MDAINPSHYKAHPSGLECIFFTRNMNFNAGNAFKYIWRAGLKDDKVQDLKKAIWYLQDEINNPNISNNIYDIGYIRCLLESENGQILVNILNQTNLEETIKMINRLIKEN